jgi:hypothetical protein
MRNANVQSLGGTFPLGPKHMNHSCVFLFPFSLMHRTHTCGQLTAADIGKKVTLA